MRGYLLFAVCVVVQAQSIPELLQQAVTAQRSGDLNTAIRIYRDVLKQRPELAEIHSNIGAALVQQGHLAEAIPEYNLALKARPGNPGITLNLALAHYKLGQYEAVIGLLLPLQPQQPDNLQMALLLAASLMQRNESGKVVDVLSPLESKFPASGALAFLLGTALLNEGQVTRAQRVLDRILRDGESAETQLLRSPVPSAIMPVVLQSDVPSSGPGSGVPTTAACHSALDGRRLPEFVQACCAWNQVIHADGVTPSTLTA